MLRNTIRLVVASLFFVTTIAAAQIKHTTTSDGVDLYVEISGIGTPCLFVHGGPGSGTYWIKKFAGETMERHFQMIYLDQRGAGRSSSPSNGDYSLDRISKDFEEVRQALGIKQWITMGHSFGGILQVGYAQRYPQSTKGMVMLNTPLSLVDGLPGVLQKACELMPDEKPCPDATLPPGQQLGSVYGKLRQRGIFWKMGYASKSSEDAVAAAMQESPYNHDEENQALAAQEYFDDFNKPTANIKVPVLFFTGKTDWMVGPGSYKNIAFPQLMRWQSEVGHVPFVENRPDLDRALAAYREKYKL